jgi:hypothetical protein
LKIVRIFLAMFIAVAVLYARIRDAVGLIARAAKRCSRGESLGGCIRQSVSCL